jgi:hypothetical protein
MPDGFIANILVFLLGCLTSILFYIIVGKLYRWVMFPICKKQKCRGRSYQMLLGTKEKRGPCYRCQCGDLYIRTSKNEFKILNADGSIDPYMCRVGIMTGWKPAKSDQ